MSRGVTVLKAAEEEIAAAADWYEARRPGLGERLIDEVAAAIHLLEEGFDGSPFLADEGDGAVRRMSLQRFPYSLIFTPSAAGIDVLAFAHARRRPGYWRIR